MTKQANISPKKPKKAADIGFWQQFWGRFTAWTVRTHFFRRLALGIVALVLLAIGSMYGLARWYIAKESRKPLAVGATFIPDYARHFDLDPKETMAAMIDELGFKRLRLVSYWENIEPIEGTYDFSELDWQFRMAEEKGVKISLALGLRQPRWPECHMPAWAAKQTEAEWKQKLYSVIGTTVNRYKMSPALESYQLENEYFLKAFGLCTNFDRNRLVEEYDLVRHLDPDTTLVISMSNNAIGMPLYQPTPDSWAISVYKRVWDKTISRRYFEYPLPAWYYGFRAGFVELTRGRPSFIHELQTEAWTPDHMGGTKLSPIAEQYKSMNPERLKTRIDYAKATGMRTFDMWGVEWWYWLKTKHNDPAMWQTAQAEMRKIEAENARLSRP